MPPSSASVSKLYKKPVEAGGKLLLVFCLAYCTTLQIEAICSSDMSCALETARHYNPEDHIIHSLQHKYLKSNSDNGKFY
jgi:hypothetical protein